MNKFTGALLIIGTLLSVLIGLLTDWAPRPEWVTDTIVLISLGVLTLASTGVSYLLLRDSDLDNPPNEPTTPTTDQNKGSPYIVGSPIKEPTHFFGRKAEIARFFGNLNSPQIDSVQVLGIRRAGKTSFLRYVSHPDVVRENINDADNTLLIYIDLQDGVKTAADFYLELAEGINRTLPKGKRLVIPLGNKLFPHLLWRISPKMANLFFDEPLMLTRYDLVKLLDSPQLAHYRLIFLLDEFERLWEDARPEDAPFDANFFTGLRSLVNTYLGRLAWVTSSYTDLYRLSEELGKEEKTSPFFNIFDPDPLVLGGLTAQEANDLIRKPAQEQDINLNAKELSSIKELAGPLPFFLQAAGKAWFEARQRGQLDFKQIKGQVKQQLASAMRYNFDWYWRHFEEDERKLLKAIALKVPNEVRFYQQKHGNAVLNDLLRYGLITRKGNKYLIASEVFAEWIRRADLRVTGRN